MKTNLKHYERKNGTFFAAQSPMSKPWREMTSKERYDRYKVKWYMLELRVEHEDITILRTVAAKKKMAVSELIRTYITWGLENDGET